METNGKDVVATVVEAAPEKAQSRRKAKGKPHRKPANLHPKSSRGRKARKATSSKLEKAMADLAVILIESSAADQTKSDLAAKLQCNHGTVYRWTAGEAFPIHSAYVVIAKMKHRIPKLGNVRLKRQAEGLLKQISNYLEEKI